MEDCYNVIKECELVVFTSLGSFIGRGVYEEIDYAKMIGVPILYLQDGKFFDKFEVMIFDYNDWKVEYAIVITSQI